MSGPEPKKFYHSDIGTLFPFNNHAKVQTRDSLVDIYQYTIHILFTLLLPIWSKTSLKYFLAHQVTRHMIHDGLNFNLKCIDMDNQIQCQW